MEKGALFYLNVLLLKEVILIDGCWHYNYSEWCCCWEIEVEMVEKYYFIK